MISKEQIDYWLSKTEWTASEKHAFHEFLESEASDEVRQVLEAEFYKKTESSITEEISGRMLKNIRQEIGIKHKAGILKLWKPLVAAASVLIILTAGLSYFYFKTNENKYVAGNVAENNKIKNEIVPGGNKAILTLADGSTIILDSAQNGMLSQQGNANVIKLQNGKLAYKEVGTAPAKVEYNTISTPRGGQYQLELTDGSKVWLNAASSITFPSTFSSVERKVFITGEAYFEVAQKKSITQENIPFLVVVNSNSFVKVLGTHFNINAYDDEPFVKTSLVEGRVKVYAKDEANARMLSPGQQSVLVPGGKITVINDADMDEALAWRNGKFLFKSADIETMLRQIARWYDVEVVYKGRSSLHFTGQLNRTENVFKLFEKLQLTGEVHFTIEGRKIIVTP